MKAAARGEEPDTLFGGTLTLHQPARGEGYRVNVDAVLLAWFAGEGRRATHAVDLGAGVGAVGLSLLYRNRTERVLFVESDRALSEASARNLIANGWHERGLSLCADVSNPTALPLAAADMVVCNPPYTPPGRGRLPRVATPARVGELALFTHAARRVLGPRGQAYFVYPAPELVSLFETLRGSGLEPKRLCLVHASAGRPARIALVAAVPAKRGGLVVAPPFIERNVAGPTRELAAILAPRSARRPSSP